MRLPNLMLLLVSLVANLAAAEPVRTGPGQIDFTSGEETLQVFTYKPPTYRDGPILLVFHGVNRNAEDYRNFAICLAERFKAIVAAPLFDRQRFSAERYQRGGLLAEGRARPREAWTFAFIPRLVEDLRQREGRPLLPYYLIGHSAGGQFLTRLAAFLPGEAIRIVAANPGSHLFPTRDAAFGYGFGGLPEEWANDAALRRYLAAPLTLYLGTGDINPDDRNLDRSEAALAQGRTRYDRGRTCFEFARKLATARGWEFGWRKVETPGIGHDAAAMFAASEAGLALFGEPIETPLAPLRR